VVALSEQHNIGETFLGDGAQELRKLNPIDIRYEAIGKSGERPRQMAIYSQEPVYNPAKLQESFSQVEAKRPTNPKRWIGYLIGTIKGIGEKPNPT